MIRAIVVLVALSAMVVGLRSEPDAHAQGHVGIHSALCSLFFPELDYWQTTCYPPAQVALAERALRIPPVSPRPVVWRLTHRRLRLVAILRDGSGGASLYYLFGKIARTRRGLLDPNSPRTHYIQIGEGVGHLAIRGMRVSSGKNIDDDGKITYGPWFLETNLSSTGLTLQVKSGDGRALVARVARGILREARQRGKLRTQ